MEQRTYKIFDADDFARLTKGIKVAQCMRTGTSVETKDESEVLAQLDDLSVSERLFCSFCNASFDDATQQRQHYKLDWHRYNLKKRLADRKPLTEENFSRLADLDDVSSISGSESESEGEASTDAEKRQDILPSRHTKVFFENQDGNIFSVYRCLLHGKKDVPERDEMFVPLALNAVTRTKWAIIMLGGGHFAAGIFQGREVIAHKTFHCYTVRKGQGGTQSSRDSRSGGSHPKSAGASLRRYNEAALLQHVQDIMSTWAADLSTCDLVFYRASGHNMAVLFGGRSPPLSKSDSRLRSVPFPTRRATFSEVKRVQEVIATLEVYGSADGFRNTFPQSPRKKPPVKPDPPIEPTDPPPSTAPVVTVSPRQKVDRAKARRSPVRPLPDIVAHLALSSDSSDSGGDVGANLMTSEDLDVNLDDSLREFDDDVPGGLNDRRRTQKRPARKRKPKEKKVVDRRPEMASLRRQLLTACSAGDLDMLTRCLSRCVAGVNQVGADDVAGVNPGTSNEVNTDDVAGVSEVSADDLLTCLNEAVDESNNRLLHVAAQGGHTAVVRLLMEAGSDPGVKNKKGHPPYVSSLDKETRNTFRRFLAEFPDRYDYDKSLIPGGLTDDILKDQAEKRRAMNKAKRDRIKQKRKEDDVRKAEQSEKERFLQLTDREKRALAAERRLLSEAARGGGGRLVVSRCFLCAADISGKVPFEYDIHRFCSIVCLKSHRMMSKS